MFESQPLYNTKGQKRRGKLVDKETGKIESGRKFQHQTIPKKFSTIYKCSQKLSLDLTMSSNSQQQWQQLWRVPNMLEVKWHFQPGNHGK